MESYVYIIHSHTSGKFYVGECPNLDNRLKWHNDSFFNTNTTRTGIPWELFYFIKCKSREQARKIEKHIKRMKSRIYIENLKKYPQIAIKLLKKYK